MTQRDTSLPIAIIGAGPVGLAAAAHLAVRDLPFVVLEAGPTIAHSVRTWGHVQLFSPWRYCIDAAAEALLSAMGWQAPDGAGYPTGNDLIDQYLTPLATHDAIAPQLRLNTAVVAVTRAGIDKLTTRNREQAPFVLHLRHTDGSEDVLLARAVIDASGTWSTPNPLGAAGVPAPGEQAAADAIVYGIPDVRGMQRARYAGKRILVAGSGHSAFNAVLDLAALAADVPGTEITWVVRRGEMGQAYGGGANDALPARGALGQRIKALVEHGVVRLVTGWRTDRVLPTADGIVVQAGERRLEPVDEVIVATGLRPDLAMLRELRLGLDPAVEAPTALAPLIDPNLHSCGTVPPHGVDELAHPEPGFYMVGMKSYGRAPTFLLLTGYEQVRSVAAALAGDWVAARDVQLVLPETGVCSGPVAAGGVTSSCCGPSETDSEASSCCGSTLVAPVTSGIPLASAIPVTNGSARANGIALTSVRPNTLTLTEAAPTTSAACCAATVQATCCEAEAKADCCGTEPSSSCGCQ